MEFPKLARGARMISLGLHDHSGKDIGKVVDWVLDVQQGCIVYVIAEFFEAPGYYPIPWKMLASNPDNSGYVVDQTDVMRTELFMNAHDLFEMAEDPYFLEKIGQVYSTPRPEPQRTLHPEPEQARSNGNRAHAYTPSREYVPLDAVPQLGGS